MSERDILVNNKYFRSIKDINDEHIEQQIVLIENLHKIFLEYKGYGATRINSIVGKRIENIKVIIKRLKKDLQKRQQLLYLNDMDSFILENGEGILARGEEGLSYLKDIDYIGIIKRSMKKNEITLGRTDERNLIVTSNLEIGSLKNVSYNLVEEDIYDYLRRVRIKRHNIDLEKYINKYIDSAYLSKDSKYYIELLLMIPYEALRIWNRYINNKSEDYNYYLQNIKSRI